MSSGRDSSAEASGMSRRFWHASAGNLRVALRIFYHVPFLTVYVHGTIMASHAAVEEPGGMRTIAR